MATANLLQTSVSGGTQNALSLQGDGVFFPKASTTSRLALTLTTTDKGFIVYDTTDNNIYFWNGAAWESVPSSGDAGANGSVQYNDNGIVSGATNFVWDKVNSRVGIGTATPTVPLYVTGNNATATAIMQDETNGAKLRLIANSINFDITNGGGGGEIAVSGANPLTFKTNGTERVRVDASGNVGIGVTPSAWRNTQRALQFGAVGSLFSNVASNGGTCIGRNVYESTAGNFTYIVNDEATLYEQTATGTHAWYNAAAGTGNITFTQAMTLDASGNLLVGVTSGTFHRVLKGAATGAPIMDWVNFGSNGAVAVCTVDRQTYSAANAAACALRVGDCTGGSRSINASGSINANGADYAEYMTKAGDFTIEKGDVAGIDSNGMLTNVFADAISFVVKSTDPSYVGNDNWGTGIEGAEFEAARELVDRIAFAGQVPVNVIGATAGDYIVPVVNGTAIKGIAVSNPTFEQYKIAVGKVITIDTDGRARIIVKVA